MFWYQIPILGFDNEIYGKSFYYSILILKSFSNYNFENWYSQCVITFLVQNKVKIFLAFNMIKFPTTFFK